MAKKSVVLRSKDHLHVEGKYPNGAAELILSVYGSPNNQVSTIIWPPKAFATSENQLTHQIKPGDELQVRHDDGHGGSELDFTLVWNVERVGSRFRPSSTIIWPPKNPPGVPLQMAGPAKRRVASRPAKRTAKRPPKRGSRKGK